MADIIQDAEDFLNDSEMTEENEKWLAECKEIASKKGVTMTKFKDAIVSGSGGTVSLTKDIWHMLYECYLTDIRIVKDEYTSDIYDWFKREVEEAKKIKIW